MKYELEDCEVTIGGVKAGRTGKVIVVVGESPSIGTLAIVEKLAQRGKEVMVLKPEELPPQGIALDRAWIEECVIPERRSRGKGKKRKKWEHSRFPT